MSKEQIERMAEDRCLVSNTPTDTPTQKQFTNYELDQIDEMANTLFLVNESLDTVYMDDCEKIAKVLFKAGWRKQSEVIDEFAERLKEAPIKCGLPLLGLSTKEEIEEHFNDIMLQVRDAIEDIAKEMKGGE